MSSIDLNINNYTYNDILKLFSISDSFNDNKLNVVNDKLAKIRENYPQYYDFFYKASMLITFTDEFLKKNIINEKTEINQIVNEIKKIQYFEKYDLDQIIKKLNFKHVDANYLKQSREMINVQKPTIQEQITSNNVHNSLPNLIAPGSLNTIKRITHFLNLNINTCFRNNYYNSNPCDFLYNIPIEIKNVVSMRLASIELPNSWYLFSSLKKNNIFTIETNNNGSINTFTIVVPDGNYENSMLENYLNTTYFYQSSNITDLTYIKFVIDPFNFKSSFELVSIAPGNFYFTITFLENINENMMNTLGWLFGFRLAKYKNIIQKITSEGLFDAGGDRYVYVAIEDYQYNTNSLNIICFDQSIMEKNIIAKIPMINGKLSLIIDDNSSPLTKTRKYNGPVNLRNLYITIYDQFGNIIDINNMDYSFTLELEILYEGFNFTNINS